MTQAGSRQRTFLVCGLLLCASFINYMDRNTLSIVQNHILDEWRLTKEQIGAVEENFSIAFAIGSLVFGFVADAVPVRWLYPAVLIAWSAAGIATGFVRDFNDLLICRTCLGFFEAGHWPCAMQTTRRILSPADRGLGNSVLQSGTSIGAIITPLICGLMVTQATGSWRGPFVVLGIIGLTWAFGWLSVIRHGDIRPLPEESSRDKSSVSEFFALFRDRRFWVLLLIVIAINTMWQFFRTWLPLFMVKGRGYSDDAKSIFNGFYYAATDVGCLAAGFGTKWLHGRGWTVFGSRRLVYTICAAICTLSLTIPLLPKGPAFLAVWLIMGMGALGVFPCYYSFTQDLSVRHPAKVFGMLSAMAWAVTGPLHKYFGRWIDYLESQKNPHAFDYGLAIVGVLPIVAAIGLWVAWPDENPESREVQPA